MKRIIVLCCVIAFLSAGTWIDPSPSDGQPPGLQKQRKMPPGLEKGGKVPPGFSEGKKAGWEGNYPPGWDQKSESERLEWRHRVREGRENISRAARERGMTEAEAESAANSYEERVRRGEDLQEAEGDIRERVRRGERIRDRSDSVMEETVRPMEGEDSGRDARPWTKGSGQKEMPLDPWSKDPGQVRDKTAIPPDPLDAQQHKDQMERLRNPEN